MSPLRQFRYALATLGLLIVVGTLAYAAFWRVSLLDGLYFTVITLSTVGYRELREPSAAVKMFTIGFILSGAGALAWAARSAAEIAVGSQFREYLGKRHVEQQIAQMNGHAIICGFGRMGQQIAENLGAAGRAFVVVDASPDVIERVRAKGHPHVHGDASDETVLRAAGIERAGDLVAVASSDADNVFIVLTARGMARGLRIVARSSQVDHEQKLKRVGADSVVSPYVIGGRRMAAAILRPHIVEFLEMALGPESTELGLESVEVTATSGWGGRPLEAAGLQDRYGVAVVAMKRDGIFGMAPDPDTKLAVGDVLMVFGPSAQVAALGKL